MIFERRLSAPELHTARPQQLGRFPFWQSEMELIPALRTIYQDASRKAVDIPLGTDLGSDHQTV